MASKSAEGRVDARILSQENIRGKAENIRGCPAEGLLVEEDIPDTGSAVLRKAPASWVEVELPAGRVGAEQRSEAVGLNGLSPEKLDQVVGRVEGVGQESVLAGDVAVRTTDKSPYSRAAKKGVSNQNNPSRFEPREIG